MVEKQTVPARTLMKGVRMNLIEAIQAECDRLRRCISHGVEIGPAGKFYILMAQQEISKGEQAIASGDVTKMVTALASMKEFQE